MSSQEREDESRVERQIAAINHWVALPKTHADYYEKQADYYKGLLFDAWKALRGQSKGLQRQRRIIDRLRAADRYRWRTTSSGKPTAAGMFWIRAPGYTGAAWFDVGADAFYHDGREFDASLWAVIPPMPTGPGDSNG